MSEKELLHNVWLEMSTPELDKQLQQELQKEDPNEEVVLGILRILQEREEEYPIQVTNQVQNAWKQYISKGTKPKKTGQKQLWFARAAVAAAIAMVILALPRTVGAESLWDVLARWTESVFEFFSPEQDATDPAVAHTFRTEHPGLQQVYDKVTELGATEPVVPMWLPEGFELTELKVISTPDGDKVRAFLSSNNGSITLSYRVSADIITSEYQKEETGVEAYEFLNVSHFIMDNNENLLITWTVDGVECSINTDIEREEVYKLIDSIYRMEIS